MLEEEGTEFEIKLNDLFSDSGRLFIGWRRCPFGSVVTVGKVATLKPTVVTVACARLEVNDCIW